MRRNVIETAGVGVVASALVYLALGSPGANEVCGAQGPLFAWRTAVDGVGASDLTGSGSPFGPTQALAWALAPLVGAARAWAACMSLGAGVGAAAVWGFARHAGATPVLAAVAVGIGAAPPLVFAGIQAGSPDLFAVVWVAAALTFLPRSGARAQALGVAAVVLCGLCDARLGAVTGLAAAAAGGGSWALFAALVAAGLGASSAAAAGSLDPADVAAPFLALRPGALGPGLAVVAALLWGGVDAPLRRAGWLALVFALGPVLQAFGEPLTVSGAGVPLPALLIAVFADGEGWQSALLVAAVAAGLGLARRPRVGFASALVPLALAEAWVGWAGPSPCLRLEEPVALAALAERTGGVLDLPVEVQLDAERLGAPPGAHGLYLFQRRLHGRPLAVGPGPLRAVHPLYGEPGVVLALDAGLGAERFLIPPARPGETLRGLGIAEIVVHRTLFSPQALALLDPLFFKLYGAPQRDHAGQVDLYRIADAGPTRPPTLEPLHASGGPAPAGWLALPAYLAAMTDTAPVRGDSRRVRSLIRPPQESLDARSD